MTRLKELRKEFGYTQAQIGAQIGISQQGYASYENGKNRPDMESLIKLANIYNVSLDYLLGLTDDRNDEMPRIPIDEIESTSYNGEIVTDFSVQEDEDGLGRIMRYMDKLGMKYAVTRSSKKKNIDNLVPMDAPLTYGAKIKVLGKVPAGVPIEAVECVIDEIDISKEMAEDEYEYLGLLVSGDSMFPEYLDGDIVIIRKQNTADTGDDVVAYVNGYDATLKRLQRMTGGIRLKALNPQYESKFFSNEEIKKLPVSILGVVVEMRRTKK